MVSQTPTVELASPTASDAPPSSCESTHISATVPVAIKAVETSTSSNYTHFDNITETEETPIKYNEQGHVEGLEMTSMTANKQKKKETEDCEAEVRDLDLLADTVRSIVTVVVDPAASESNEQFSDEETEDENVFNETLVEVAEDTEVVDKAPSVLGEAVQEIAIALPLAGERYSDLLTKPAPSLPEPKRAAKRKKRCEYSDETRALCVHRHQSDGVSYATISKEMGIPHDTVRAIVRKAKRTGTVSSAPRSGRPRKTSGIVDKVILEAVKANKQCSAKSIQEELLRVFGVKISPETVRRRVLDHTKQRMQSISNGASSKGAIVLAPSKRSSTFAHNTLLDGTGTRLPTTITGTSIPDSVSFQEMLQGGASTPDSPSSLTPVIAPVPRVDAPAASVEGPTSAALTIDDTVVPSCLPHEQPESEPSSKKRPKRGDYSIETREQCVALHAKGQGYRKIGKTLNMPHTTVRAIVEKAQRTGTVLPAKRSGRPRKTDEIVDKVILQAVKANEKSSARMIKEQLLAAYGVHVSCETIRRRVKDHSRQCFFTELPDQDAHSLLGPQQTSQEQEHLAVAMAVPHASLMTFDENGVHI